MPFRVVPRVGARAPDFQLPMAGIGDDGYRLSEQLKNGPVVLLFYPFAFSPGCGSELADFQQHLPAFRSQGYQVSGISVDSPFAQHAFADQLKLGFPLLSDFNRRVSRRYGVLINRWGLRGFANRSVVAVGCDGRVSYRWDAPDLGILPAPAAVIKALAAVAV